MIDSLSEANVNREAVLRFGLLPAAITILVMAVVFSLVGALVLLLEVVVLANIATRLLAMSGMYLLPHLLVGAWFGNRHGVEIGSPIAAGIAPVVVFVVALAAFGGPIATPFLTPGVTIFAIIVWTGTFTLGMLIGTRIPLLFADE